MFKTILSVVLVVAMIASLCVVFASCETAKANELKVGFIFLHDENSTYDLNFINAAKAAVKALGLTDEEIEAKFGFLVDAYKYGAAPHGGMGIGLDRLAMIMCGADSLRDVTAFPKVQNASELMSACPATVDKESLDILGIAVTAEEKKDEE